MVVCLYSLFCIWINRQSIVPRNSVNRHIKCYLLQFNYDRGDQISYWCNMDRVFLFYFCAILYSDGCWVVNFVRSNEFLVNLQFQNCFLLTSRSDISYFSFAYYWVRIWRRIYRLFLCKIKYDTRLPFFCVSIFWKD